MERISVLIADDSEEYSGMLHERLSKYEYLRIEGVAKNGHETLDKIYSILPDILLLDIVMPGIDGIEVLERLQSKDIHYRPIVVVISAVAVDFFIRRVMELGAHYYFVKPMDTAQLAPMLRDFYLDRFRIPDHEDEEKEIEKTLVLREQQIKANSAEINIVDGLLRKEGLNPFDSGYIYLREAILMDMDGTIPKKKVSRVIYPLIAKKFGTTPKKVERAARSAVEKVISLAGNEEPALERPVIYKFIVRISGKARIEFNNNKMK
ncbi:MAG: response regulator [Clostridiales bacterium]|nr:response regulator [Clostridiales bacterium]